MDFEIRPGTPEDIRPAYDVFRHSLWDLVERQGLIAPGTPNDIEASWERHKPTVLHIAEHAAEFWVAEDDDGLLGVARSLERDGVFQLTEFFVHPRNQSGGVGRGLLERAFPVGRGRHRNIVATQDIRALALYLKFGVSFQSTMLDSNLTPAGHDYETDVEFVPAFDHDDPVSAITEIDRRLLDHDRSVDIEFILRNRPGFLYRRDGRYVGYGFESNGRFAGPILVEDPRVLPAALSHMENSAAEQEIESVPIEFAMDNTTAVDWLLSRGHRFFGFYLALLSSDPFIPRDRYMPYGPTLFF